MSTPVIRNLLVIRLGALGDCMHVLPSLQTLQTTYPGVQQHWLVQSVFHSLLASHANCWPGDKPKGILPRLGWLWQTSGQLAKAGIDGAVNLHPSLLTHLLCLLTFLRQGLWPLGRYTVYAKQKLPVTGAAERPAPRRHAITDFYQPFRRLLPGLPAEPDSLPQLAGITADMADAGTRTIGLIVGVGGKRPNRAWPISHWARLIQAVCGEPSLNDATMLLIGGPEESAIGNAILAELPPADSQRVSNTIGNLSLPQLVHTLRNCQVVLGGDTGPLHVAAASGCPHVIGLYAPTSVARTGPVGVGHCTSFTPPPSLSCWPCEQPTCQQATQPCMAKIPVEQAMQALLSAQLPV